MKQANKMAGRASAIYISGPMTGLSGYNYPAFFEAEEQLRAAGYTNIENPARNPEQKSWADYMKTAIRQMLTCDVVAHMKGWGQSEGARIEVQLAVDLGFEVLPVEHFIKKAERHSLGAPQASAGKVGE